MRLDFYSPEELCTIIHRSATILGIEVSEDGAEEIARRSRGTPRIANRLLKRTRDFAQVKGKTSIDREAADYALDRLRVDKRGLDEMDRRILLSIVEKFSGGPVGIQSLAVAVSEEQETIEDVYEPFLIQQGFLQRTPRGRIATPLALTHLGVTGAIAPAEGDTGRLF
jgi:Holliday junction DNA helicase RuvB